jgi:two-component system cell cycle sensor histidine kinase/response regulator CckA
MSASRATDAELRLLDLVNEGVALGRLDGRILRVNDAVCRIVGLSEEELLARSWWDLVEPGDRDAVERRLHTIDSADAIREPFRFRLVRPDGSHRWLELTASLDREQDLLLLLARDVTGRHVMDLERLMMSFDHAALGMALVNPDGRFVRANQTLCTLLEVPVEDLRGADLATFVVGDAGHWCPAELQTGAHASFQEELRLRGAGGREIVALVSGTLVADSGGRPEFYVCQVLDMTERHEALEALARNEAKLAEAQQLAELGSWEWDLAGGGATWSAQLERMLGGMPPEAGERPEAYLELVHPDDRARVARVVEAAIAEVRPWSADYRIVRPDGELRMIHARGEVLAGEDGRARLVRGTSQDVTERRRVEDALRAAERLFRRAFDDAPIGMALMGLDGTWLRVNRALAQMLGRDEDELRSSRLDELSDPDDRDLDRPLVEDLLAGRRRAYAIEKRYRHADGSVIHALAHVSLMHGDDERPLYFLCQLVDLTESRRGAEERAALEHRLAQAQRLESVGQLAGGVAHDFNNLLSVILTCVGFARRELAEDDPVRKDVEEIGRAADRAAALTRQLLMFSRREVVQPAVIDVGALVTEFERLLTRTLSERIALRIAVEPGAPAVLADRAQLEQVLVNLAVNARDAMPDGGTLTIAVGPDDGGVRVTVADDGAGMTDEVRERAFEPFFTTKPAAEGTGLGLATVHGVVAEAGGRVELESAPGRGSTVTVWLPGAGERAPQAEEPAAGAVPAARSARVLVVEDQGPVRRQARRILEGAGFAVRDAAGAEEALGSWAPVDVLVTDVVMPGMTGTELARRARARAPELRVVLMSGHTDDVVVRAGARAGSLAFVQKPFTRETLLAAVDEALAAPADAIAAGEW